jgi:hypothetical protein
MKVSESIDDLDLVDSRTLSLLCPFVLELKTILSGSSGNSKTGQNIGPKHITPIAALSGDPALQLEVITIINVFLSRYKLFAKFLMQLQLEASFIQTQPTTVRQTLEFVTERLTALCTTHLQETVVLSEMQALEIEVQDKVQCEAKHLNLSLNFSERVASLKVCLYFSLSQFLILIFAAKLRILDINCF